MIFHYIIDFEGYTDYDKFIFKEISLYDIMLKSYENYFIKSPCPKDIKTYYWLLKYYHKIPYYYGFIRLNDLVKRLKKNQLVFYVKGENKLKILSKIFPKTIIINLEDFGCLPYSKLSEPVIKLNCDFHHTDCCHCALSKINKIANWYINGVKSTLV